MEPLVVAVGRSGRVTYRIGGQVCGRPPEGLAACCRRLGVRAVVLPGGRVWPATLAEVVAGVEETALPVEVAEVSVAGCRLVLADPLGRAAWRFVVAAVAGRRQAQSVTTSTGSPSGSPPARSRSRLSANPARVPSGRRTRSRAGQAQADSEV